MHEPGDVADREIQRAELNLMRAIDADLHDDRDEIEEIVSRDDGIARNTALHMRRDEQGTAKGEDRDCERRAMGIGNDNEEEFVRQLQAAIDDGTLREVVEEGEREEGTEKTTTLSWVCKSVPFSRLAVSSWIQYARVVPSIVIEGECRVDGCDL